MKTVPCYSQVAFISIILAACMSPSVSANTSANGLVLDTNGRPVQQALVTITPGDRTAGATALSVFTDESGNFSFPESIAERHMSNATVRVRALGYRQLSPVIIPEYDRTSPVILMTPSAELAGVAPASAWMPEISDPVERNELVMSCVGCHQFPAPEVRNYAGMLHSHAIGSTDPAMVRKQAWENIFRYMNFLAAEEILVRGVGARLDREKAYAFSLGKRDSSSLLSKYVTGPLDSLEGYVYGAPLIVTPDTVIREYEIPRPNAIREAALMGDPPGLWVADFDTNRLIHIDPASGKQRDIEVPADTFIGPHTLHPGKDDHLWLAPQFNGVVGRLNTVTEEWRLWTLQNESGRPVGIHDLSFDWRHELVTDLRGRIWFSDTINNAVGFFDPETGEHGSYPAPEVPGRSSKGANLYGIVMTSDRRHVWYSQLGIGTFGSLNTETLEFEELQVLPEMNSGPRRLAISDKDILYVALFGAGQIIEYDTRAGQILGTYDLPDRASAPYAVTWDAGRQVVWVSTSNANVIYRFDPASKTFGVLPLPREGAFLRMLLVDHKTGNLATSYANLPKRVHGPRMALIIEPGDRQKSK